MRFIAVIWCAVIVEVAGLMCLTRSTDSFFVGSDWLASDLLNQLVPNPSPADKVAFYQVVLEACVALFLLIPAYATIWVRDTSLVLRHFWLAHWTAALVAFAVHIFTLIG